MNTTDLLAERPLAEEIVRLPKLDGESGVKNGKENGAAAEADHGLALAPLVDKIAYGIAKGLVIAMKELENHIASETRKVGASVGVRLDALQASIQDITEAVSEQRSWNASIQETCRDLAAGVASLKEADVRQEAGLASLRSETTEFSTSISGRVDAAAASLREADAKQTAELALLRAEAQEAGQRRDAELDSLRVTTRETSLAVSERIDLICKDLTVQQEDIAAIKQTLCGFATNFEGFVQRLDRQADALRTMCAAYAQRETELESLMDGLARLRAYPAAAPIDRL